MPRKSSAKAKPAVIETAEDILKFSAEEGNATDAAALANAARDLPASEEWEQSWNIHRRLLEARRRLAGLDLQREFEGEGKSYHAFSIHKLARVVEEVLNDLGVISHFAPSKWQQLGNKMVVEGNIVFTDVDSGETSADHPCLGEGIDDSDKGMGKATSYARKNGLVSALNLALGVDNEADKARFKQPQQKPAEPPKPEAKPEPELDADAKLDLNMAPAQAPEQDAARNNKSYTIKNNGEQATTVLGFMLTQQCWVAIFNTPSTQALTDWVETNRPTFKEFQKDSPADAKRLKQYIDSQFVTLRNKGV